MSRRSAGLAAAVLVVVILLLTLWPLPEQAYRSSLSPVSCLVCGDQGVQDVFQNIVMLLPLGLMLGLAGIRPGRAALGAFALACCIETLQYFVVPGRDASVSDVLTNTTGAWLGALLAPHFPTLLAPPREAASRLAVGAVLVWAVAWGFGAWAMEGSIGAGNWRARFPGDLPDFPALTGIPVQATLDQVALGLAPASLPGEVERRFSRDSFDLRVRIRPAPPRAPRENVVTVIDVGPGTDDENNHLVMLLNRVDTKALLSFRINAARARLRTPSFNLGNGFGPTPSGEASLEVSRARGLLHAVFKVGDEVRTTDYRIGPELLWAVLAPRTPQPGWLWTIESFFWGGALLVIVGYWTGRSGSVAVAMIVTLLAVAAQLLVPRLYSVASQSALGWTMLLGGLLLGAVLGGRRRAVSSLSAHP